MKKRRLGRNSCRSFQREQPFAALNDVLHRHRFSRFTLVEKGSGTQIGKIQEAAERDEKNDMENWTSVSSEKRVK